MLINIYSTFSILYSTPCILHPETKSGDTEADNLWPPKLGLLPQRQTTSGRAWRPPRRQKNLRPQPASSLSANDLRPRPASASADSGGVLAGGRPREREPATTGSTGTAGTGHGRHGHGRHAHGHPPRRSPEARSRTTCGRPGMVSSAAGEQPPAAPQPRRVPRPPTGAMATTGAGAPRGHHGRGRHGHGHGHQ